nr:hypothetical protein [Tanacetum cinerariifolium]
MNHQTLFVPQIAYQSPQAPTQPMTELPLTDSGSLQPTINLELPLIRETKPLFRIAGLQCNKFRGDKGKVILVLVIRVMLTSSEGNNASGHARVVKCYNYQAEEVGQILDEEKLTFLADPGFETVKLFRQSFQTMLLFRLRILILMILTVMISRMQKRFSCQYFQIWS